MSVENRKVYAIRVSDNLMLGSPLLIVGYRNIESMEYHSPMGEGDKHYVDVNFINGTMERFFDIVTVQFEKEGE